MDVRESSLFFVHLLSFLSYDFQFSIRRSAPQAYDKKQWTKPVRQVGAITNHIPIPTACIA